MASNLKCDFCGVVGFLDKMALKTHQVRSGLCKSKQKAQQRALDLKVDLESAQEQLDGKAGFVGSQIEHDDASDIIEDAFGEMPNIFDSSCDDPTIGEDIVEFDVTFQLVFFMQQCHNGGGLSQKDMNQLLRMLRHPLFDSKKIRVRNAADVCKYEQHLADQRDDKIWQKMEVREASGDIPSIQLFYRNPLSVLEELFSNPKNRDGFALRTSVNMDGTERLYTDLQSGKWWTEMQHDVESTCSGAIVAPLILYSDQTALSHNRRTQGWPLVLTLGNINSTLRGLPEGHALLAILPIMGANDPGLAETKMPSRIKLELLHKCQEIILGPLKEASYSGISLMDPFGNPQWVFPRLCLYICDQTEGSRMTCTFDTNKSMLPCSCCVCPKDSLSAVSKTFPYRTQCEMKEIFMGMQESSLDERELLSKKQSIHPVQCSLWGFAGGHLPYGNPYRCIQVDGLHQSLLGVFKILVGIVRESAKSHALVAHPLQELDRRLLNIHKHCRYASFRLPGSNQSGYFQSNANFHGFEHKFVMQVVVFCLLGVVPHSLVQVFVDFIDWYVLAFRNKKHSQTSLAKMDMLMKRSVNSMKSHAKSWQKSNFDLVKIHAMSHMKDCIQRCGLPLEYDTGIYEHMHIALMKIPYRHSNKRDFMGQLVRHNQRKKVMLDEADMHENLRMQKDDLTALDKAVGTGQTILSGKDIILTLNWVHGVLENREKAKAIEVQNFFENQPEVQQQLMHCLEYHLNDNENCTVPTTLQLWNSLAVPAGEGSRFSDWPMYTRACRNFHGRPWFGFVELQMEAAGDKPITWVGQLRLIFSCEVRESTGKSVVKRLALVRLMEPLANDGDWKLLHCVKLQWVTRIGRSSSRRRGRDVNPTIPYMVIDVANIARVVQVVPNFTKDDTYFLNRFQ